MFNKRNPIMLNRISLAVCLLMFLSSCVSKKIYTELEDKYANLKKENRELFSFVVALLRPEITQRTSWGCPLSGGDYLYSFESDPLSIFHVNFSISLPLIRTNINLLF